jgi:hypothetical protein
MAAGAALTETSFDTDRIVDLYTYNNPIDISISELRNTATIGWNVLVRCSDLESWEKEGALK